MGSVLLQKKKQCLVIFENLSLKRYFS